MNQRERAVSLVLASLVALHCGGWSIAQPPNDEVYTPQSDINGDGSGLTSVNCTFQIRYAREDQGNPFDLGAVIKEGGTTTGPVTGMWMKTLTPPSGGAWPTTPNPSSWVYQHEACISYQGTVQAYHLIDVHQGGAE